jgi:hypothetical protein
MMDRASRIFKEMGVDHQPIRKVWKGKKATRAQYWLHIAKKAEVLRATEMLLPHLTAKVDEAEVVVWFLRCACQVSVYRTTPLDRAMLDSLSEIKRNGGEAPAEIREMIREVIPSQAISGADTAVGGEMEGVETRSVSPNDNLTHECPAAQLH